MTERERRRGGLGPLVVRWALTAVPMVLAVSVLTFWLTSLVPGDPARAILGMQATPDAVDTLRRNLGLDRPLPVQYWEWLRGVFTGDLGNSYATRSSVANELLNRLEVTLSVLGLGLVLATVVGVTLGLVSAVRGGWPGRLVDVISLFGLAVPGYWLGLVLSAVFAVQLRWFPATGYVEFTDDPVGWIKSLALPLATLSITATAGLAKQTRSSVLDELGRDYVRMLRSRGVPERRIIGRHVLRNAGAPIVTVIGLLLIGLIGGAVLLEMVFVLPGIGGLTVQATKAKDVPVLLGVTLVVSAVVMVVNLLVELAYYALDPRVRT